jgi:uncharacterized Zn finger protein
VIKLTREVVGSTGNRYSIEVLRDGDTIAAFCDCKAGGMGSVCKHLLGVLAEPEVARFIAGSALASAVDKYRSAREGFEAADRALAEAKTALKVALRDGQQASGGG